MSFPSLDQQKLRYLSSGSYGCVFTDEKVVVKLFKTDTEEDNISSYILREIMTLKIASVFSLTTTWRHWSQYVSWGLYNKEIKSMTAAEDCKDIEENAKWFIATKYMSGKTLADITEQLNPSNIQAIAFQLLWASINAYLEKHLIHNDLKPKNIILKTRTTDDPQIYQLYGRHNFSLGKDTPMVVIIDTGSAWVDCDDVSMISIPAYVSSPYFRPWDTSLNSNHSIEFDLFSIGMILVTISLAFRLKEYKKFDLPPVDASIKTLFQGLPDSDLYMARTLLIMRDVGVKFDELNLPNNKRYVWDKVKNIPSKYETYIPLLQESLGIHGLKLVQSLLSLNYDKRKPKLGLFTLFYHRYFANLIYQTTKDFDAFGLTQEKSRSCPDYLNQEEELDREYEFEVDFKSLIKKQFIKELNDWRDINDYSTYTNRINSFINNKHTSRKPITRIVEIVPAEGKVRYIEPDENGKEVLVTKDIEPFFKDLVNFVKEQ